MVCATIDNATEEPVSNVVHGAVAGPVLQVGTVTGDINLLTGAPVRTRYRLQVKRIAPPELIDREDDLAKLASFCTSGPGAYVWWRAGAWSGSRFAHGPALSPGRHLHHTRAPADIADMTEPHQHTEPDHGAAPAPSPDAGDLVLQISSSLRSTWLWAPDKATVSQVRAETDWSQVRHEGKDLPLVMGIDIGVTALAMCEPLAATRFTSSWHESEYPLSRTKWPVQPPRGAQAGTARTVIADIPTGRSR